MPHVRQTCPGVPWSVRGPKTAVLAGVTLTMLAIGLVAAWIPARHALAVDPMILLREE